VSLPESYAASLRSQAQPVLARVEKGRCLVDLRCIAERDDAVVAAAIVAAEPAAP
jgi:L-seryl-tRNA(Ser) seleniumtransferase